MAEETETEAAPKRGGKKMILAVVLVVGALVGGGAGAFFAGPALANMILGPADAAAAEAHADSTGAGHEAEEADHGGGHGGGHGAGAANHLIENLVLNPAQSNGTRFLMASVSLDLGTEDAAAELEARDAQVRDALLTVLGHKTVDELTNIAGRDSLKSELKSAVSGLFPEGTITGIYLPQFVIQ